MAETTWEQDALFNETAGFQWQIHVTASADSEQLIVGTRVLQLPAWEQRIHRVQYFNKTIPGVRNCLFELWDSMADQRFDWGIQLPILEIDGPVDAF